jgi:hypothetical protein
MYVFKSIRNALAQEVHKRVCLTYIKNNNARLKDPLVVYYVLVCF